MFYLILNCIHRLDILLHNLIQTFQPNHCKLLKIRIIFNFSKINQVYCFCLLRINLKRINQLKSTVKVINNFKDLGIFKFFLEITEKYRAQTKSTKSCRLLFLKFTKFTMKIDFSLYIRSFNYICKIRRVLSERFDRICKKILKNTILS